MTLDEIMHHFDNTKQISDGQFAANCPSCGDTKRHLYIKDQDGKILTHCKKGCTFQEVVNASGLKTADFFPKKEKRQAWVQLREHIYTDEQGQPIGKKVLFDKGDSSKTAVWYRYENCRWIKGLNGLKMPPYHVQNLLNGNDVILAEGEKDVETIERMGFRASCSPEWRRRQNKLGEGTQPLF